MIPENEQSGGQASPVEQRLTIVSADGHASAPLASFKPYLEQRYHDDLDELHRQSIPFIEFGYEMSRYPDDEMVVVDQQMAIRSGGTDGAFDVTRRLAEMDREGIAAELVIPSTPVHVTPFFSHRNDVYSPELRFAGARAYHRWLADMLVAGDGRLIGVAEPGPCLDMDATVAELRWVGEHGFRAVSVPGTVADPDLPPLWDPYYEPFWATCDEMELTLFLHAGHGNPQGKYLKWLRDLKEAGGLKSLSGAAATGTTDPAPNVMVGPPNPFESLIPRQVLWSLFLSRVFDRYPDLYFVPTEVRGDWVPATLAYLDSRLENTDVKLSRRPSEYWASNCFVGLSFIHRAEVQTRTDIGVDQMMFGRDYPHPEGTWPNTWDWIRAAFEDTPEADARKILGENAMRCYHLDTAAISAVAARLGPLPADLLGPQHQVDPAVLTHFQERGGFAKPVPAIDERGLDDLLLADLASVGAGPAAGRG